MHCVSEYPTNLNNIGFNVINDFLNKYDCMIGYSDHSGNLDVSLISLGFKISALEVHVTFNKNLYNPDFSSSIDFKELEYLSNFIKLKKHLIKKTISKNKIAKKLAKNRKLFSKSLALFKDMKSGQKIKLSDITLKKPGTGLKWNEKNKIIGKELIKDKSKYNLIKISDVKKK